MQIIKNFPMLVILVRVLVMVLVMVWWWWLVSGEAVFILKKLVASAGDGVLHARHVKLDF